MVHDLRAKRLHLPVLPDSKTVRERLKDVLLEAEKLKVLLKVASEIEQLEAGDTSEKPKGGAQ